MEPAAAPGSAAPARCADPSAAAGFPCALSHSLRHAASWVAERRSVWLTDAALTVVYGGLGVTVGFKAMALVQLPIIVLAAIAGAWLFSLQHRFKGSFWMRSEQWSASRASL